jgi:hypothetical protein
MAYTVTEGAMLEVTLVQELAGQAVLNMLHYKLHFTGGSIDVDGVAAINHLDGLLNVAGGLTGKMSTAQVTDLIWKHVRYQWIFPTRYGFVELDPSPAAGAVVDTALPPNDGIAFTKRAERSGRQFIGTFHMGGIAAGDLTAGEINGVRLAAFNAVRDELKATYTYAPGGEQFIPVIYHRAAPADSPVVVNTVLQTTSRINRRRTVGLGI